MHLCVLLVTCMLSSKVNQHSSQVDEIVLSPGGKWKAYCCVECILVQNYESNQNNEKCSEISNLEFTFYCFHLNMVYAPRDEVHVLQACHFGDTLSKGLKPWINL